MSTHTAVVKKFINDPETVVPEALAGMAAAHAGLVRVDLPNQLVIRADAPVSGKVGLVSGGGSGHEPMHGGFVGTRHARRRVRGRRVHLARARIRWPRRRRPSNGGAGVLHIVKNYTGDVLNFKLAAELAEDDGIEVQSVVLDDDVAVQDSLYTAGRRGDGRDGAGREDRRREGRGGRVARRRRRHLPQGEREGPLVRGRADLMRDAQLGHADLRPRPRTRSRSASASTASRAGGARR